MRITKQKLYQQHLAERALTLEQLAGLVKDEKTKETICRFRKKLEMTYPNRRETLMQKIPKLLFAGTFRRGEMKEYNGWVLLEADYIEDREKAMDLRKMVSEYPQTLFAMVGASGRSVKFVVPYTRPDGSLPQSRKEAELFHAHAYRHALKTYEPRLSYPIELKQPFLEQSCLLSYDEDVFYNPDALTIHLEQPVEMPGESFHQENFNKRMPVGNGAKSHFDHFRYLSIQYELALQQSIEKFGDVGEQMDFKPILVSVGELCSGAGVEEEDCVKWTRLYLGNWLTEVEIRETIGNTYSLAQGFGNHPVCKPEQLQALKMEEFMGRRYDFRFNTMTEAPEYRERNTFCFDYRPVTDRVMNSIALNAQKEGLQLWDRDVRRYIYSDRLGNYAPVEAFLSCLPVWDGKDRIRQLAARIPCNNLHWKQLFYTWFLSMVAHWQGRDRKHGNSVSPLLVGGQGCGKSTFCFNLLPPELNMYYTDSIDFSKRRDAELYLTRFALINIDEFDQVSEKHQGFLKHLLQKPVVNLRKPYAAQVEAVRRYASFIATSNHVDLLSDPTGSRRFICIEVRGMIDNKQPVEYDQLYAQAVAALDKGERYWLTREEEELQMQANEEFQQRPLYEDLFYRFYRPAENKDEGVKMLAGEIYQSLQKLSGMKLPVGQVSHFGRFLKKISLVTFSTNRGRLYPVVKSEEK